MEAAYFPMFVNIKEKRIVVVGGGRIAVRRIGTLLKFAEDITVIAPEVCPELAELHQSGRIAWKAKWYASSDVEEADIVLAATDQREINRKVAGDCRRTDRDQGRRILVNVADDRSLCDFYFPGIVQTGELVIGINSGGQNPGEVSRMRKRIERLLEEM